MNIRKRLKAQNKQRITELRRRKQVYTSRRAAVYFNGKYITEMTDIKLTFQEVRQS